jgi:hypothetical protein
LDRQETLVGRDPLAGWLVEQYEMGNGFLDSHSLVNLPEVRKDARNLPEVLRRVRQQPFQVRLGETLFIGIPPELALARRHFRIRHVASESGGDVFLAQDLRTHCGTRVNNQVISDTLGIQLNDNDRISCGAHFVFNIVREQLDLPGTRTEPPYGLSDLNENKADGPSVVD